MIKFIDEFLNQGIQQNPCRNYASQTRYIGIELYFLICFITPSLTTSAILEVSPSNAFYLHAVFGEAAFKYVKLQGCILKGAMIKIFPGLKLNYNSTTRQGMINSSWLNQLGEKWLRLWNYTNCPFLLLFHSMHIDYAAYYTSSHWHYSSFKRPLTEIQNQIYNSTGRDCLKLNQHKSYEMAKCCIPNQEKGEWKPIVVLL